MATIFFISAPIYPHIYQEEETKIATAIAIAGTTLTIDNTQGFAANDYIVLGTLGNEDAEIVQIVSVDSDIQLTIGATNFAHAVDDSVRRTPFNQIKFYRSTTETGSYTADGTENMQVDNKDLLTGYSTTTTNARTMYWKITYYNSTTSDETSESDADAVYGASALYCNTSDVYSFMDIDDSKINPNTVNLIIEGVSKEIDSRTNSSFISNTATDEYHDGQGSFRRDYLLAHAPIISVSSLSTTQDISGETTTWDALTEGRAYDYIYKTDIGKVTIIDDDYLPPETEDALKVTYTWGYSSIPNDIRRLAILMSARDLRLAKHTKDKILGDGDTEDLGYTLMDKEIDRILAKYTIHQFKNT
jgi:hypothetical protein